MLEFYYDCLMKYMKPNSFELTETDTDKCNEELVGLNSNLGMIMKFLVPVLISRIQSGFQGDVVPDTMH